VTIADMVDLIELGTAIDARRRSAPPATGSVGTALPGGNPCSGPRDTALMDQQWSLAELRAALDRYEADAVASTLKTSTKLTYVVHARRFVDWLGGGYEFPADESPGKHRG
jgi:hypothetical protein